MKCTEYAIVPMIKIIKSAFTMIEILAPILAIVALSILLFRMMISPDDKKLINNLKNSVFSLVIIFLIPFIINLTMAVLGENFDLTSCWNNASKINLSSGGKYIQRESDKNKTKIINDKKYDTGGIGESSTGDSSSNYEEVTGGANLESFMSSLQRMSDFVKKDRKNRWYYKWPGNSKTFAKANKANNTHLTCILLPNWALREIGVLKESQLMYQHEGKGMKLSYTGGAKEALAKHTVTYHFSPTKTFNQIKSSSIGIKRGDIIFWKFGHTNVYAGTNSKGKTTFYDGGRGSDGHRVGGVFYFDSFGPVTQSVGNRAVQDIIRFKD